jgi:hypothetical protein|tara:strand:- start:778 stop:951 length:174 start_codon:yes stop_codon:yes gene_type:complete
MSSKQDEFLDKLETLCREYSDGRGWEWKLESDREDGLFFKYFYVDIRDEGIDEDTDE